MKCFRCSSETNLICYPIESRKYEICYRCRDNIFFCTLELHKIIRDEYIKLGTPKPTSYICKEVNKIIEDWINNR